VLSYYQNATKNFHISRIEKPTEALKLHSHDYYQIYFVVQGDLVHHLQEGKAMLSRGDVFLLPPNIPHYIEPVKEKIEFVSLSFMPEFLSDCGNKMVQDFLQTLAATPVNKIQPKLVLNAADTLFADSLLKRIGAEFEEKKTAGEVMIRECLLVLLTLFARIFFEENAEDLTLELKKKTTLLCMEYIQNHFDEAISLSEMSRLFAMSRTSFCNLFLSTAGMPFKEYLNSYRIDKACEMLRAGEKASTVSENCGFSDYSTFHRCFKKKTGLSPTQYRIGEKIRNEKTP
jgi:AraC-like DNA-binding protein